LILGAGGRILSRLQGTVTEVSFALSVRQVGEVSVLDVGGRVTLSKGSSVLGDTLRDMVSKGHKKILVNFGQVSYLDSSAIGELVSGYTLVAKHGGQLKLLGLTKRVRDLLLITKSYTVFDVQDDEAAAINSFA
jgi:anti-sigma B factor antagonist